MKSKKYREIGIKLRKDREYLNLTQEQVANIMNLGRDAIIRIESGKRKIDIEEIEKFSRLYKISIDDIINSNSCVYAETAFARGFDRLSEKDIKEIINLIKLKNEYKDKKG